MTPGHGGSDSSIESLDTTRDAVLEADGKLHNILEAWWNRWRTEYLADLRRFHARGRQTNPIKLGDVVVISDAKRKRPLWSLGRIERLYAGRDGHARAAQLRTATGITNRPIQTLYPLEISVPEDDINASGSSAVLPNQRGEDVENLNRLEPLASVS